MPVAMEGKYYRVFFSNNMQIIYHMYYIMYFIIFNLLKLYLQACRLNKGVRKLNPNMINFNTIRKMFFRKTQPYPALLSL